MDVELQPVDKEDRVAVLEHPRRLLLTGLPLRVRPVNVNPAGHTQHVAPGDHPEHRHLALHLQRRHLQLAARPQR